MTMWTLLQLADSAFPTGAFAHSGGLEAAMHLGHVRDDVSMRAFARASVWQAALGALPFVGATFDAPSHFCAIDRTCDATITNQLQNRASRAQGHALLSVATDVFSCGVIATAHDEAPCGHLAPAFGVTARAIGIARREALMAYAHAALRGVLSAGVRLGIVGPYASQRIHHELAATLDSSVTEGETRSIDDAAQASPLIDIWQGQHEGLYARLFQS